MKKIPDAGSGHASMTRKDDMYRSGEYARKNPTYHVEDSAWKAGQVLQMIRKHGLAPRTVCEVGCGAGEILRQLQPRLQAECEFSGYEISPQAFALCRGRGNERLRFFQQELPSGEAPRFDLLLCIDVLEHIEDYIGFLRRLRGKSEQTILHIPLDLSAQWVLRGRPILREREQAGHLHYFMKDTALAALEDAGYTIVDWFYTAGAIDHPRSVKARLASLPRRLLTAIHADLAVRMLGGYSLLVLAR